MLAAGCFTKPPRPDDGDGPTDGGASARPVLVDHVSAARVNGSSVAYPISIPDDAYLLVALQLGSNCDDSAPALALAEVHDPQARSLPLISIAQVTGTPCLGNTHSELFELRAPAAGTYSVVLSVAGVASSLHSAALVFTGVDRDDPTRMTVAASGEGAVATVAISSAATDLVVDAIGHGTMLVNPGPQDTTVFLDNIDSATTLSNSAASTAAGTGSIVEMTWHAAGLDQWQAIAAALRAAGEP